MHVVTSGHPSLDIDGYAACIALAELLRLQGEKAVAASGGRMNATIPPITREWGMDFESAYKPTTDDTFTVLDVSDPEQLDQMVDLSRIAEIIDHHPGFEEYWKKRGTKAQLEFVGAACTMVYERWRDAGPMNRMSTNSARLLICGILDNTLNLEADITTVRDRDALTALLAVADLPKDWPAQYFSACQEAALADPNSAILDDLKVLQFPSLPHKATVGQLALWNAQDFITSARDAIVSVLSEKKMPWFMNLIDLHTNQSVFLCQDPELKTWLAELLGVTFADDTAIADRMWLRKEIMKQAIDRNS